MDDSYPLRMQPVFKDYIWGGSALKKVFKKDTPYKKTAESWEVAVHKDGCSTIANGKYAGETLEYLMKLRGEDFVGKLSSVGKFPLMLKLIDAKDKLSVQVHPDDVYADKYENGELGKTEMWYVLDAEDDAQLIYGFKDDITEEELAEAIELNKLKSTLNYVSAKKGDVFFIEAGTVHAIGAGLLLAEIQQNSNTTYRLYDWDRTGDDGKPRPLHTSKAIDVCNLNGSAGVEKMPFVEVEYEECTRKFLNCCRYFASEHVEVHSCANEETDGRSFHIVTFIDGSGRIKYEGGEIEADRGNTFVIPADMGEYNITGNCEYLKFYIAEFEKDILSPLLDSGYTEDEVLPLLR